MKKMVVVLAIVFLALLAACNNPLVVPADLAVTLPPNQDFILRATLAQASETQAPVVTPVRPTITSTFTPSPTTTQTPTRTPIPTRKSPYPVSQGQPLIDMGFQSITLDNVNNLSVVFRELTATRRHAALSADGQKLFLSTSNGTFVYDRQGKVLAHWQNIFTPVIDCESCISVNRDGSRLAVISRNAGIWEAQVYDVVGDQATLFLAIPVQPGFAGTKNEASIAISPDNAFLAFKAGSAGLRVLDLQSRLQVLDYERPVTGVSFTPDGASLVIHAGQEMLFFKVTDWKSPINLLLPREETAYAFSPDGKLMAIGLPTGGLRVYSIENIRSLQEINVPPANATNREWQLVFQDNKTLSGYAVRWDTYRTTATIESGQWDIESGKALRFDTKTGSDPDALSALWGSPLPLPVSSSDLETGANFYNAFRFISDGILQVNSPHSACWLKLFNGESTCFKNTESILFASDANTFKEVRDNSSTRLVETRTDTTAIQVGPYRIAAINRSGEWALIDTGTGTDLYIKGKKLPQESVKGSLQGFAENAKLIVFSAREKENTFTITVVDKATGNAIYQKKDNFLYKPVVMTADGTIYYVQNELEHNQAVFNMIDPHTLKISELTRLSLPSEPLVMTLSASGLFAIGQLDGNVLIMTRDGSQSTNIQAATSAIEGLAFSPDGRFLAVASLEGVRVYSILASVK